MIDFKEGEQCMEVPIVYVLSDSVGETAEFVTKAAISQFDNLRAIIKRFPYIKSSQNIDEIVEHAVKDQAIIIYTLVKPEIREYMNRVAESHEIHVVDIMGPVISTFEQTFSIQSLNKPGLVRQLDEDYFKRVEAIEFAVKYDDGKDPRGILSADIVLIGVSRTSKTPLSQYLAMKKYKVANVPIVPEIDPPDALFTINPSKCIGLKISPEKLNHIRIERLKALGLDDRASYANIERIKSEIDYFDKVIERLDCKVIDVSSRAVEETANNIIAYMESN